MKQAVGLQPNNDWTMNPGRCWAGMIQAFGLKAVRRIPRLARLARMTRTGTSFVMLDSPLPPPFHRNPFLIRVIRAIHGSNCRFSV
jgi:hypothetical protein